MYSPLSSSRVRPIYAKSTPAPGTPSDFSAIPSKSTVVADPRIFGPTMLKIVLITAATSTASKRNLCGLKYPSSLMSVPRKFLAFCTGIPMPPLPIHPMPPCPPGLIPLRSTLMRFPPMTVVRTQFHDRQGWSPSALDACRYQQCAPHLRR